MTYTTVKSEELGNYPALIHYCRVRNESRLDINRGSFYFPNAEGKITSTYGGYWPVPAGMSVEVLCNEINALVKELGIEILTRHNYWLSTSTHPELNARLWDERGYEMPKGFGDYLAEVSIKKVDYPSAWGVYFSGNSYYIHPVNAEVEYIEVDGRMRPSLSADPVYVRDSMIDALEVKNLATQAYNHGVANTTSLLYETLKKGGF